MADAASIVVASAAALVEAIAVGTIPTVVVAQQVALAEAQAFAGAAPTIELHRIPIQRPSAMVHFDRHYWPRSYSREQQHTTLFGDTFSLKFWRSAVGGGKSTPFAYPLYKVFACDGLTRGVQIGSYAPTGTEAFGNLTGSLTALTVDEFYLLSIVPYDSAGQEVTAPVESMIPYWVSVDRRGECTNCPYTIFQNNNWDWIHTDGWYYWWAKVPKALIKTRVVPLTWFNLPSVDTEINSVTPHVFPGGEPFDTPLPPAQITRINWSVTSDPGQMSMMRPSITSRGIMVTENDQDYSIWNFSQVAPVHHMLDGPRGVANVANVTALWVGHGGSIYGCDTFSFWRYNFRGEKHTFAGLRHKYPPYWEDDKMAGPPLEIVGDWDASIPADRRWPWESWGLVFDLRASKHDFTLPTIDLPPFGPLPQHLGEGPVAFCTCRFGRVLKFQFHKLRPADPPTITEFITGLSDPWGLAIDGDVLYVTERTRHAISMWSADDGRSLGDLLVNPSGKILGTITTDSQRKWRPYAPHDQVLAAPIVAPEGLAVQDGWCYWAALAQNQVRRINIATRQIEVGVAELPNVVGSARPHFIHISLSDGTFGPRGTIFTATAHNMSYARPIAWIPSPGTVVTELNGTVQATHTQRWTWHGYVSGVIRGPGGSASQIYPYASAVGNGMLVHGGAGYGLDVFTKATLGEPIANAARIARGRSYYLQQGYRLIHGNFGFGFVDIPLPWGENADLDYTLEQWGHVRP
jgi:hypothetical protein